MVRNLNPNLTQISALIPTSTRQRIDRIARDNNVPIGRIIREAIAAGMDAVDMSYTTITRSHGG